MRLARLFAALLLTLVTIGAAAPAQAATTYTARLSAASEVPPNDSRARGAAVFQLSADGTETALEHGSKTLMASRIVDAIGALLKG